MYISPEWLLRMAEKENGCIISVGGLVAKMKETIFTHCNVCGIKLQTEEEEQMGMSNRCAYDWQEQQ